MTSSTGVTKIFPSPASRIANDLHQIIYLLVVHDDFELDLGDGVEKDLGTTHVLLPAVLVAAALYLRDGHAANALIEQRLLENLKLLLTNNSGQFLHGYSYHFIYTRWLASQTDSRVGLVQTREGGVGALAVLGDIQAQGLLGLLNTQAAAAKSLHCKHDGKIENEDDGDRDHNAQDLRDE